MAVGAPRKYTHTLTQAASWLRKRAEFKHLRGGLLYACQQAIDFDKWPEADQEAYRQIAPFCLWRSESTNMLFHEAANPKIRMVNLRELTRRMAFLYGVACQCCGKITTGYAALPVESRDDPYRMPFDDGLDLFEPLCPRCRSSFQAWCEKYAADALTKARVDLLATGWTAFTVSRQAAHLNRGDNQ